MNGHHGQDETFSHLRIPTDVTNEPEKVPNSKYEQETSNDQTKNEVQHILSQDIPRKRRKYGGRPTFINGHLVHRPNKSRRVGHSALFSFEDMSPGGDKDPIKYGLHASAARLSYEFSGSPNASDVNSNKKIRQLSRILPKFSEKTAQNIKIVGNIPAGQIVPVESSRHILIATTW